MVMLCTLIINYCQNGKEKFKTIIVDGEPKYRKRHIVPGERIESPEYVLEKGLKIDYRYYISNQLKIFTIL